MIKLNQIEKLILREENPSFLCPFLAKLEAVPRLRVVDDTIFVGEEVVFISSFTTSEAM